MSVSTQGTGVGWQTPVAFTHAYVLQLSFAGHGLADVTHPPPDTEHDEVKQALGGVHVRADVALQMFGFS